MAKRISRKHAAIFGYENLVMLEYTISIIKSMFYIYFMVPLWSFWIRWLAPNVCRAYDNDLKRTNEIEIIYHDTDLLIVNKPYDVNITAAKRERESSWQTQMNRLTVEYVLQKHFPLYKLRNLHQIDYPTSGVYMIALNKKAASRGGQLFLDHQISKEYLAIVRGHVTEWTEKRIEVPIGFDEEFPLKRKLDGLKAQHALTLARVVKIGYFGSTPCTLMSLRPITGRTHQLRLHMLSEGYPIIGDFLYEHPVTPSFRMMLHSYRTVLPFSKLSQPMKHECRYTKHVQKRNSLYARLYLYLHDVDFRLCSQRLLKHDVIVETPDPFSRLIKPQPSSNDLTEYKKLEADVRLQRFKWVCQNIEYKHGLMPTEGPVMR